MGANSSETYFIDPSTPSASSGPISMVSEPRLDAAAAAYAAPQLLPARVGLVADPRFAVFTKASQVKLLIPIMHFAFVQRANSKSQK